MMQGKDITVFITISKSACDECGENLGRGAWITLTKEKKALCLGCADLDHLVFLPAGDTALTRRARKHSTLVAVVIKWSRARHRYERQGLLVENQALDQAENDCLQDSEARARRREREAKRRAELDREYIEKFASHVRELFPKCPPGREIEIAEHACLKYSERIGRSAAAKSFNEEAIRLAVIAHVRHTETPYAQLLSRGFERWEAREKVTPIVEHVLERWEGL
ncbi:MAG: DUF2293 domain-containing protein [Acidobacteriota bacterium]